MAAVKRQRRPSNPAETARRRAQMKRLGAQTAKAYRDSQPKGQ